MRALRWSIFLLFATVLGYSPIGSIWAEAKRKVRVIGALDPKNQAKTAAPSARRASRAKSRPKPSLSRSPPDGDGKHDYV